MCELMCGTRVLNGSPNGSSLKAMNTLELFRSHQWFPSRLMDPITADEVGNLRQGLTGVKGACLGI